METRLFFRLLLNKWGIILLTMFFSAAATLIYTLNQPSRYSASALYIVSPSSEILTGINQVGGLSVLGGQPSVANTYATIATSAIVMQNASNVLGIDPAQASDYRVSSRVQSGTHLIEITVEGTDPLLVQAFANRIGRSTVEYVDTLYNVYDMRILESAKPPDFPIYPNMRFNLTFGAVLGLALGIGLAFLTGLREY